MGSGLESVKIPYATTSIGEDAFNYCDSLKTIYIHSGLQIAYTAFGSAITNVYYTGEKDWEEFALKVGIRSYTISGTKTYVSSYTID